MSCSRSTSTKLVHAGPDFQVAFSPSATTRPVACTSKRSADWRIRSLSGWVVVDLRPAPFDDPPGDCLLLRYRLEPIHRPRPLSTKAASRMLIRSPRRGGRSNCDWVVGSVHQSAAPVEPELVGSTPSVRGDPDKPASDAFGLLRSQATMPGGPPAPGHVKSRPTCAEGRASVKSTSASTSRRWSWVRRGERSSNKDGPFRPSWRNGCQPANTSSRRGCISSRPCVLLFRGRAGSRCRRAILSEVNPQFTLQFRHDFGACTAVTNHNSAPC